MRKTLLLVYLLLLCFCNCLLAQPGEFCRAISTIAADAPNQFRNVRGDAQGTNTQGAFWNCSIMVPGTIHARFVRSMGLFYEGALSQSPVGDEVKKDYARYKAWLDSCLLPLGYKVSLQPNFNKGLEEQKKIVYMPPWEEAAPPPHHYSLEALYSKDRQAYTLVLYIFEH